MRKIWVGLTSMLLIGGLLAASPTVPRASASPLAMPAAPAADPGRPTTTPAKPVRGKKFTVKGQLPTKVSRAVQLEIKSGKKWKKIATAKTDKKGNYTLTTSTKSSTLTLRVVAKKTKIKSKTYKAITTKSLTVTTVAPPTLPPLAPAAPAVSPAKPMKGEKFTVNGRLSTKTSRPVQLEVKSGKKWKKIATAKTDKKGNYTLTTSTKSSTLTLRVVAKKTKIKGKTYQTITTKSRKVTTAAQSAKLAMPVKAQVNEAVRAQLTFAPARSGRPVRLEALTNGKWTSIATGFQTANGSSTIALTATTVGTFTYRGVAPAWRGAPAVNSASVRVTITPSEVKVPEAPETPKPQPSTPTSPTPSPSATPTPTPPTMLIPRPLSADEASAITDYDAEDGTIVIDRAPASLADVSVGNAIAVPPRDEAPSGALRKVVKVTTAGGTTTIKTEDANLPDVIEDIPDDATEIGFTVLTSEFIAEEGVETESVPLAPRAMRTAGMQAASSGALKLQVSRKGETADNELEVELKGSISVLPHIDASVNIDWFKLMSYRFGAGVQVANDLTLAVGVGFSGEEKFRLGRLEQTWAGAIGPVPVWLQVSYELYASISANGSIAVTSTLKQIGTISGGITNSSSDNLAPKHYTTNAPSESALVELKASGGWTGFAGIEAQLMMYSTAGPYLTLGAEAKAEISGELSQGFTCTLSYGPMVAVGVKTSRIMELLTGTAYKFEAKVAKSLTSDNRCPNSGNGSGGGEGMPLAITTANLPAATVDTTYSAILAAVNGDGNYTWSATGLPPGITLNPATGKLSGTPTVAGDFGLTVTVTDGSGGTASKVLELSVLPGMAGETLRAIQVAAGSFHTCAVTTTGAAYCWGSNASGQLGNNTTTDSNTPTQVTGLPPATTIAAGNGHTCAVTTAGAAYCWGSNASGQLGNNTTTDSNTPSQVTGLPAVTTITAGAHHTCAATTAGVAYCWGSNAAGLLGNNTIVTGSAAPVQVTGLPPITTISAAEHHTCAVTSTDKVYCWGWNHNGQLGNTTDTGSPTPIEVTGLPAITAITAANSHTCTVAVSGTVHCWGSNRWGQLGNATDLDSRIPVLVNDLSLVTSITAGTHHTCANTATGAAYCWGLNGTGALGDGTTTDSPTPSPLLGLPSIATMSAGGHHTCATATTGTVYCWGRNDQGQLGNGTNSEWFTPNPLPDAVVGFGD